MNYFNQIVLDNPSICVIMDPYIMKTTEEIKLWL